MTQETYNKLFREMVLTAYTCGCCRPHEVICNFDRGLFSALNAKELTFEEANVLYDKDINWRQYAQTEEK